MKCETECYTPSTPSLSPRVVGVQLRDRSTPNEVPNRGRGVDGILGLRGIKVLELRIEIFNHKCIAIAGNAQHVVFDRGDVVGREVLTPMRSRVDE